MTELTIPLLNPIRLAREIEMTVNEIDWPASNDPNVVAVRALYTAQVIAGIAKRYEKLSEPLKTIFADKLDKPCDAFELTTTSNVTITAKVNNPRETFDKDAFIRQVAEKFDLSQLDLINIANTCTKKSKAPVSLTATYNERGSDQP